MANILKMPCGIVGKEENVCRNFARDNNWKKGDAARAENAEGGSYSSLCASKIQYVGTALRGGFFNEDESCAAAAEEHDEHGEQGK